MSPAIKICGLIEPSHLQAAAASGATHAGFNFFPRSPRFLSPEAARRMRGFAPRGIVRVALFVDAEDGAILDACAAVGAEMVQLHGAESPDRVAAVKRLTGLPVVKALPVAGRQDLAATAEFGAVADMLLFDAKPPAGADRPGGHGRAYDWGLLAGIACPVPWLLSGGLTPDNVGEAVRRSGARGVDVASGVEREPGVKDPLLIRRFCQAAQAAFAAEQVSP